MFTSLRLQAQMRHGNFHFLGASERVDAEGLVGGRVDRFVGVDNRVAHDTTDALEHGVVTAVAV